MAPSPVRRLNERLENHSTLTQTGPADAWKEFSAFVVHDHIEKFGGGLPKVFSEITQAHDDEG